MNGRGVKCLYCHEIYSSGNLAERLIHVGAVCLNEAAMTRIGNARAERQIAATPDVDGEKVRAMTSDEKDAIRKQLDVHEDEMNSYSRCECGHDLYNAAVALLAEIDRLEVAMWGLISPSSNLHDASCSARCLVRNHFPGGTPVADCNHSAREWANGRILVCLTCHPELTDDV